MAKKYNLLITLLMAAVVLSAFQLFTVERSFAAAKGYVTLKSSHTAEKRYNKVGKYYFWEAINIDGMHEGQYWYAKNKNGNGKKSAFGIGDGYTAGTATDGKRILFIADDLTREAVFRLKGKYVSVYSKRIEDDTRKSEEIITIKNPKNHYWTIAGSYKNRIYLQEMAGRKGCLWVLNLKTKKLKKIQGSVVVEDMYKNYIIGYKKEPVDYESARTAYIFKIKKGAIKKKKTIKQMGNAEFVGGKLYYTCHPKAKGSMQRMTLYRSTVDGKKRKVLGKFKLKPHVIPDEGAEMLFVDMITSKSCKVYGKEAYRFTYKGKKLKKTKDMRE